MFPIILALFLAVVVLAVLARSRPKLKIPALILAVVVATLAIVRVFVSAPEPHLPIDIPPEEALGFVLAQRVQADHPEGGKVIVFGPETDEERLLTISSARMDGIRRVLGERYEVVLRGPRLRYGSLEDRQAWLGMETGFPVRAFQQWAATDGDAVAAISTLGMPGGQLGGKTGLPPLYVVELRGIQWDPSRPIKGVAALVTYRSDRDVSTEASKELQSVFDQHFVIYPPRVEMGADR